MAVQYAVFGELHHRGGVTEPWLDLVYEDWPADSDQPRTSFKRGARVLEDIEFLRSEGVPLYDTEVCSVCGTSVEDYYMVAEDVWYASGVLRRTQVHIRCLEQRLGRTLTHLDFPSIIPVNEGFLQGYALGMLGLPDGRLDEVIERVSYRRSAEHMVRLGYERGKLAAGR